MTMCAQTPCPRPVSSNKDRARAFKVRMMSRGFAQANVWVPVDKVAEVQILAEALRDSPNLEIGPLRDSVSGRLIKFR